MNNRKERAKKARHSLKIWFFTVSQVLGIAGALTLGFFFDSGIQGFLVGYAIGVIISFGGVLGLS